MCRSLVKVLSNRERASEEVDPVALLIYAVQGGGGGGDKICLKMSKGEERHVESRLSKGLNFVKNFSM